MSEKVEQKVVTVCCRDGAYHNFFHSPGSIDSLESHIKAGWIVVNMNNDIEGKKASVLFQREKKGLSCE